MNYERGWDDGYVEGVKKANDIVAEVERLRSGLSAIVRMRKAYPGCPCTLAAELVLGPPADLH